MTDLEWISDNLKIIESLKKIPALRSLAEPDLEELLRLSEIRNYLPGDLILEEGSYDGWIYHLISGKIKIEKRSRVLMELQRVGDVFGEMGFLEGKASSASVSAVDKVQCMAINVSDASRFPDKGRFALRYIIYREFAENLASRLRSTTEEVLDLRKRLEKAEQHQK